MLGRESNAVEEGQSMTGTPRRDLVVGIAGRRLQIAERSDTSHPPGKMKPYGDLKYCSSSRYKHVNFQQDIQ
jgi:hypothetical protein